jgi:hypothetical protein
MRRRASVANDSPAECRERVAALTPDQRVARTFELGRRHLELYAAASGHHIAAARLELERRRQSRRRPSASLDALLR